MHNGGEPAEISSPAPHSPCSALLRELGATDGRKVYLPVEHRAPGGAEPRTGRTERNKTKKQDVTYPAPVS